MALFDSTVSSVVLWCTESWARNASDKQQLQSARNKMLRKIVGIRRSLDQTWVDWIVTLTRFSRKVAREVGARCWLATHPECKWR